MAPYNNQYAGYYDPAGSQANQQPAGYRYQAPATSATQYPSAAPTTDQTPGYQNYGSTYWSQQYGAATQGSSNSTAQAASSLNNLSSTNYNAPPTATAPAAAAPATNGGYENPSSWGTSTYGSYTTANPQVPNRSQSSESPLYATQNSASTFGRLSVPEQTQPSSSSTTYAQQAFQNARASATPSNGSYQTAYTQAPQPAQTQQPQQTHRYASPLHAAQGHYTQPSRGSAHQASPQLAPQNVQQTRNRQQSASVEPAPATVNPSQVYDDSAERRRKAQIETEKRRKREEEEAARKAEEERIAAEERAAAEQRRAEEAKRKSEQDRLQEEDKQKAASQAAATKAELDRKSKNEERRKKREEKRQSKTAATVLQKMASSGSMDAPLNPAPVGNPEEVEMRAMFQKMREFNAKNPAMLAQLWEEERKTHSSPTPAKAAPAPKVASAPVPQPKATAKAAAASTAALTPVAPQINTMPAQQYRPFQKPPPPTPKTAAQNMTTSTQPMASQSTSSLWPPQKKGSLAEAAAKWLMALPENTGKAISKDSVLKILEANPSYVQLCEALESNGLRFERSLLARELLKAVPDGLKTPGQQLGRTAPLPTANGTTRYSSPGDLTKRKRGRPSKESVRVSGSDPASGSKTSDRTVEYEAPRFTSLADAARIVNSMGDVPVNTHMQGGPVQPPSPPQADPYPTPAQTFGHIGGAPSQSQQPEIKPSAPPEEPRRPPANKEEAARKTFGDLVDLTADDSDNDGPPPKMLQTALGQINGVSSQPQPQPQAVGFKQFKTPMTFNDFYRPGQRPIQPVMVGQGPMHPIAPAPPAQMVPPRLLLPAQPSQPAQSTQPPAPSVVPKPKGPNYEHMQQDRVKGKMLVEPIMRDRVARRSTYDSRTIARDVLLATGRHPDMRALNSHLASMQRLLGTHGGGYETEGGKGDRSDLSTIRWDIVDPDEAKPAANKNLVVLTDAGGEDADDEDDELASANTARHVPSFQVIDNGDGTAQYVSVQDQLSFKDKPKKKPRGRRPRHIIPGTTNSFPKMQGDGERLSLGQRDSTSTPNRQAATTTAPRSAPAGGPAAAGSPANASPGGGAPVGYAAFRQIDEAGNAVKTKGRPIGWRKNVHSRQAQGLAPAKPGSSKLRQSYKPGGEILKEPKYQVWMCKWEGCRAELHNLETLKKHVVKLHGKPTEEGGMYECLWQGCEAATELAGGKGKGRASGVAEFASMEGWVGHVDQAHLQPVAWELGDGPRGGMSDHYATDSEAPYLSDAHGRSVTPLIVPDLDRAEAASLVLPKALRRAGVHMTKDERKAAAELGELEAQKRVVGVEMDRLGVRMASRKRRVGFLDDEDFEDEMGSEDEHGEVEDEDGE
ncbi:hypothetical protein LTR08_002642 [Meristemomyces frigidus]|nr:hypothetical protein LTR08_002642 [Meristemomyces frigidus]